MQAERTSQQCQQCQQYPDHVVIFEAMFGLPAEVRVREAGEVRVHIFSVGHTFTDNANAKTFATEQAERLAVTVDRASW